MRFNCQLPPLINSLIPGRYGDAKEFFRVLLLQIYFTFITAIPLLMFLGILAGLGVSLQAKMSLSLIGQNDQLGQFLVFVLFREMAPLLCSLLIIARSVTAIASEIATMKVQNEIEALEMMGINIYSYLLAPRIWAGIISLFCMSVTFWFFSLLGSYIGSNWTSHTTFDDLVSQVARSFMPSDILFFVLKSTIIGSLIFYLACKRGLQLKKAPFEVPIVSNRAVVDSLVVAIFLQALFSLIFYLI